MRTSASTDRYPMSTARSVVEALGATAEKVVDRSNGSRHTFLVTDAEERFRRIASDFLETEIERLELVSLQEN